MQIPELSPVERDFHEALLPSLRENVEHVMPWTDLATFKCSENVQCHCTNDTIEMESLCSEILEPIRHLASKDLLVIAVGIQLAPASSSGISAVSSISIRAEASNLVFQVSTN